jgi:predicted extracellular nuclease
MRSYVLTTLVYYLGVASAVSIAEINGPAFLSPYTGKSVTDVTGLVTAVGPSGFFLRDVTSTSPRRRGQPGSQSVYVFNAAAAKNATAGDIVNISSASVVEYQNNKAYIPLTELTNPSAVKTVSKGNQVFPIPLGRNGLQPPTGQFSALDKGDIFGLPNGASKISTTNATLEPTKFGLDFWESLSGEYVGISSPTALGATSQYGDLWIRGDWAVTGLNSAGGLTITTGTSSDANPETIIIGSPLDGTKNPSVKLGDTLNPIQGVITYGFGFYRLLPTTAISIKNARNATNPVTTLKSEKSCKAVTIGQYNVENLSPSSSHLNAIADHIGYNMGSPDLIYVQELQDNSGATNDGTTSGNMTLAALAYAIEGISGIPYQWAEVDPENNLDGGQPGGNIRVAYLYNPAVFSISGTPGTASEATTVQPGPKLSLNPGRIDPKNVAFTNSRKPLVAQFSVKGTQKPFFAINVHSGSKGGSSSLHGDARPPMNGGIEDRIAQHEAIANFVQALEREDASVNVLAAGDFNEFSGVAPMEVFKDLMWDVDEVAGVRKEERYTYNYDMNCQQLDHTLVSAGLKEKVRGYQHLHVNTWREVETSDHDPSVGVYDVC